MNARVLNLAATAFLLVFGAPGAMAQEQLMPGQADQEQIQSPSTNQEERTIGQGGMMREGTADRAGSDMGKGSMMARDDARSCKSGAFPDHVPHDVCTDG